MPLEGSPERDRGRAPCDRPRPAPTRRPRPAAITEGSIRSMGEVLALLGLTARRRFATVAGWFRMCDAGTAGARGRGRAQPRATSRRTGSWSGPPGTVRRSCSRRRPDASDLRGGGRERGPMVRGPRSRRSRSCPRRAGPTRRTRRTSPAPRGASSTSSAATPGSSPKALAGTPAVDAVVEGCDRRRGARRLVGRCDGAGRVDRWSRADAGDDRRRYSAGACARAGRGAAALETFGIAGWKARNAPRRGATSSCSASTSAPRW